MAINTRTIQCVVISQSAVLDHVLAADEMGRPFALTIHNFTGDWSALQRGDVVELTLTEESLPRTMSARLFARRGTQATSISAFETLVGTVRGKNSDTPYVLVECENAHQYAVNRIVFAGDWDALEKGETVALALASGPCARVLSAWREVAPTAPTRDC